MTENIKRKLKAIFPHFYNLSPFLILILYIEKISLFYYNSRTLPEDISYLLLGFVIALIVIFFVSYLANKIFKSSNKSTLISVGIIAFLFYYSTWFAAINNVLVSRINYLSFYVNTSVIIAFAMIFLPLSKLIYISKKTFLRANYFIFTVISIFILISLTTIDIKGNGTVKLSNLVNKNDIKDTAKIKPNIYYIIVDAYTSPKSLKRYWNYDDTLFTNYLKRHNFYIAEDSKSKYKVTIRSLSASLNMSYLDYKMTTFSEQEKLGLLQLIKYNKFIQILEKLGYSFYNYSLFDVGKQNKIYRDQFFEGSFTWLNGTLVETLINRLMTIINPLYETNLEIKRALDVTNFENKGAPFFVYADFMMPHPPYYFRANGEIEHKRSKNMDIMDKNAYLEQLKFTNTMLVDLINKILNRSKQNTIIIIQGDHGSRIISEESKEELTILNTYYFPDNDYSILSKDINPVNSFRAILKKYIDQNIQLLNNY